MKKNTSPTNDEARKHFGDNLGKENLAKNISVQQNQHEIILMFLQGMKQDQNEKLDTILESVKSLDKFLQNKKDVQNGGSF